MTKLKLTAPLPVQDTWLYTGSNSESTNRFHLKPRQQFAYEMKRPMLEKLTPRLINSPGGDPGLLVELTGMSQSVIFDLGENSLTTGQLLQVKYIFISHAHVDHWIGFDRLLRANLGKTSNISIWGPTGMRRHVKAKLDAYLWNLTFDEELLFDVHELDQDRTLRSSFSICDRFRENRDFPEQRHEGVALLEPEFRVEFAQLEHTGPSLAWLLVQAPGYSFSADAFRGLGITPGPHLEKWRKEILAGHLDQEVTTGAEGTKYKLGDLVDKIGNIIPGKKIAYVTDTAFNPITADRILNLCMGADLMYCEATFPEKDKEKAAAASHLTGGQAGALARTAQVGRLIPFHFSRRYTDNPSIILEDVESGLAGKFTYPEIDNRVSKREE